MQAPIAFSSPGIDPRRFLDSLPLEWLRSSPGTKPFKYLVIKDGNSKLAHSDSCAYRFTSHNCLITKGSTPTGRSCGPREFHSQWYRYEVPDLCAIPILYISFVKPSKARRSPCVRRPLDNLGYILRYSRKLNLAVIKPRCSTGYCLANSPSAGAEYLVYAPSVCSFTVDLSAMPASRTLAVEWFNPATGATSAGSSVHSGSPALTSANREEHQQ